MRARALIKGVAGKPTTTKATPRASAARDAAAILPGWNIITGCVPQLMRSYTGHWHVQSVQQGGNERVALAACEHQYMSSQNSALHLLQHEVFCD